MGRLPCFPAAAGWRPFIFYLAFVLVVEGFGAAMQAAWRQEHQENNYSYYNALIAVQAVFFTWLFGRIFQHQQRSRLITRIVLGCFLVVFATEALSYPFKTYYVFSRILLAAALLFACCSYFLDLLRSNTTTSPLRVPYFWIVTGLFFFYLGTVPFVAFRKQIAAYRSAHPQSQIILILTGASVVLYTCWIIAFLCKKKEPTWKPS
ncbi:MAG: hypothetical protein EOO15_20295 [Chitinophagaceae bacterium]|nr:MAG: hypothetical protein EOO15_20295 [Chitinophagaceae bacterium]